MSRLPWSQEKGPRVDGAFTLGCWNLWEATRKEPNESVGVEYDRLLVLVYLVDDPIFPNSLFPEPSEVAYKPDAKVRILA